MIQWTGSKLGKNLYIHNLSSNRENLNYFFQILMHFVIIIILVSLLVNFWLCGSLSLRGLFSSCREWGLLPAGASLAVELGLQAHGLTSCRAVAHELSSTGSIVVARGLSCSAACGIFPNQRSPCVSCIRQILYH